MIDSRRSLYSISLFFFISGSLSGQADTIKVDTSSDPTMSVDPGSLDQEPDGTFLADSLELAIESAPTDSSEMDTSASELSQLDVGINKIKELFKQPLVGRTLIGAGIIVPVIYFLSSGKKGDGSLKKIGGPPSWPG